VQTKCKHPPHDPAPPGRSAEGGFPAVEPDSRLGDTPRHYRGRIIIRVSGVRVPPPALPQSLFPSGFDCIRGCRRGVLISPLISPGGVARAWKAGIGSPTGTTRSRSTGAPGRSPAVGCPRGSLRAPPSVPGPRSQRASHWRAVRPPARPVPAAALGGRSTFIDTWATSPAWSATPIALSPGSPRLRPRGSGQRSRVRLQPPWEAPAPG
jgi:hypothetical protein